MLEALLSFLQVAVLAEEQDVLGMDVAKIDVKQAGVNLLFVLMEIYTHATVL